VLLTDARTVVDVAADAGEAGIATAAAAMATAKARVLGRGDMVGW
jgi:hypothetical protein